MPFKSTAVLLKKTSTSSAQWLARQYKDPYVRARLSDPASYRSRSAFKLLEVEARHGFLQEFLRAADASTSGNDLQETLHRRRVHRSFNIVDLGAAPGGWSQVIAGKLGFAEEVPSKPLSRVSRGQLSADTAPPEDTKAQDQSGDSRNGVVYDELKEMEKFLDGEEGPRWSMSRTSAGSLRAQFDSMDPLDYLNSRDLSRNSGDASSVTTSSQVASHNLPVNIIALDILPIHPIPGVHTLQMDFLAPNAADELIALLARLNGDKPSSTSIPTAGPLHTQARVDMLLSDLSPPHTGNRTADVSRSIALLRAVWEFARKTLKTRHEYHYERVRDQQWLGQDRQCKDVTVDTVASEGSGASVLRSRKKPRAFRDRIPTSTDKPVLRYGGILVMKHFAHPISDSFCQIFLNPYFSKIFYFKPPSSRSDSTEGYWVCTGWRGVPERTRSDLMEEDVHRDADTLMQAEFAKKRMERHQPEQQWKELVSEEELQSSMDVSQAQTTSSH